MIQNLDLTNRNSESRIRQTQFYRKGRFKKHSLAKSDLANQVWERGFNKNGFVKADLETRFGKRDLEKPDFRKAEFHKHGLKKADLMNLVSESQI